MKFHSLWVSLIFLLGLLSLFVSEVILSSEALRAVLTVVGILFLFFATGWRFWRSQQASGERWGIESAFAGLHSMGLASVLLYLAQSEWSVRLGGEVLKNKWPVGAGIIAVAWPAVLVCSLFPWVLMEMALLWP